MVIDSVVWAQYVNVTDKQTATQPRRHSNSKQVTQYIQSVFVVVVIILRPGAASLYSLPQFVGDSGQLFDVVVVVCSSCLDGGVSRP